MNVESSGDQRRENWDCRNIKRKKKKKEEGKKQKKKIKRGKNNKGKESGRRIGDLE